MKQRNRVRANGFVYAFLILSLSATVSYGAVTADPAKATFTSLQQSATIKLTNDGAPIPAKDIGGWQFIVSGHDYKHMLNVKKMDGALEISPSTTMEVGSYDLNIETEEGPVVVRVFAPLSDLPNVIEKTAELTGQSDQRIKEKLGMVTATGREDIQIDLPPVYYEGQTLNLTMPLQPGHSCAWFMNGSLVAEGPEQNALSYTFEEPGEFVLTYIETEQSDGKTIALGRARAYTRVVLMPGIPVETAVNAETAFAPPPGYLKHVWRIDGQEVSTEPTLRQTFPAAGTYTVECMSTSPDGEPAQGFLRIRYITTVNSK